MSIADKYSGERYAMAKGGASLNFHPAHQIYGGRMYRCGCMKSFRLPDGKTGPNAAILKRRGAKSSRPLKMFWKRITKDQP